MSDRSSEAIVVLYPRPSDPKAFTEYYHSVHLPLVEQLPGLTSYEFSTEIRNPDGSDAEYFAYFRGSFPSGEALGAALSSGPGSAVAADVGNFASGGAIVTTATVRHRETPHEQATRRYLDAWARRDIDAILGCFAHDGRYTDPTLSGVELDLAELREHLTALFSAVPDLTLDVITISSTPEATSAFWRGQGGADGGHPQGRLDFLGGDLLRFDSHDRIIWTAALFDQETFKSQLASLAVG